MKAIITKYHSPTNTRGSRYSADDGDGNRVILSAAYALEPRENHARAVQALCDKMGWSGDLYRGSTKYGYVWVFSPHREAKPDLSIPKRATHDLK